MKRKKVKKVKVTIALAISIAFGALLWGKSVQASRLKTSMNDAFTAGDYNKALDIYNNAVKDLFISKVFKLKGNTIL